MTPILVVAALAAGTAPASAQAPVEKPAAPAATAPARPAAQAPAPPTYSYDPEGRRDPFISLLGRGTDDKPTGVRPAGVPGLAIGEITVRGVLRDKAGFIALVQGSDNKTYILRTGDKLLDGSVKSIAQDKVVFSQDVNDPLSLVKQREVPKAVRQADGRGGSPGA